MKRKTKRPKAHFQTEATLTERRHQAAIDTLDKAEETLARALLRWHRARTLVKRYDKALDKKRANQADWREIAKAAEKLKMPEDPNDTLPAL
jgi:hypothetical protein